MTEEVKKIDVSILQSIAGLSFNYRPGQVVEMPVVKAKQWQERGLCKIITDEDILKVIHPESSTEVGGDGGNVGGNPDALPEDFPVRELLIENGLDTIEKVKAFDDLTTIEDIGPARATDVANALLDLE